MNELVERYIHQVGRYLPQKERAEIEAELRSMIQDKLEDRYGGAPSQAEMASVLAELGDPRQMAASYGSQQYLVGPELYPYMMMILRRGWLIMPAIVVFVNIFGALVSAEETNLVGLFVKTLIEVFQMTFIFSAVVVSIFAVIQHSGAQLNEEKKAFNPLELPEVDNPISIDRFEVTFGIAFGTFFSVVLLYWLRVGGLTLRFDLNNPGEVIPVPLPWLILLVITAISMVILNLVALRRNGWTVALWLTETAMELLGGVGMYFVLYRPVYERIIAAAPALNNVPFFGQAPEIITVATVVVMLLSNGSKLVKLWNYRKSSVTPYIVQTGV